MPNYIASTPVHVAFHALADATRLAVVERLAISPASVSVLAKPFQMALPSFMQHLAVLDNAGITISHKSGRTRVYQLAPGGLIDATAAMTRIRNHWDRRLDQLDRLLQSTNQPIKGATMTSYIPNPDLDLVLERTLAVPVDRVWAAWTEPELMLQWFTPAPWKTVACDIDLRAGGHNVITMESPEGEQFPNAGCYLVVEPNSLLVFTSVMTEDFRPVSPANGADNLPFTARIELAATPEGGTHYRAIAMHADVAGCARHAQMGFHDGWGAALDQLIALMS